LISLIARLGAVGLPMALLSPIAKKDRGDIVILTWAGLRGGISVALALALPSDMAEKPLILTATYAVVVFTILIQGLSIERLIRKFYK
ncbi:MAG: cation:proton antiporter, partial [Rhodospirillales bacterium]|nr:cation:proton antiporter [Rhodospirillales bacterium]